MGVSVAFCRVHGDDFLFRAQGNPLPASETLPDRRNPERTGNYPTKPTPNTSSSQAVVGITTRGLNRFLIEQVIYPLKEIYPASGMCAGGEMIDSSRHCSCKDFCSKMK